MDSKNEKPKSQTSTPCEEAGSQAPQAQENRPNQEIECGASSPGVAKEPTKEAPGNNGDGEKVEVDEVQNVAQKFLAKRGEKAAEYIDIIEDMLGDYSYRFAEQTLIGIYDFIEKNNYITDKQIEAIDNIKKSIYERQF